MQYQIESMEAQLRTFDNKVDYSTVYLDVSEVQELTPVQEETLWERISGGFMEDLKGIGHGGLEILVWLAVHIPTILLWAIVIALFILWIRWYMKRSRQKAQKKAPAGPGPIAGVNPSAGPGPMMGVNSVPGAGSAPGTLNTAGKEDKPHE